MGYKIANFVFAVASWLIACQLSSAKSLPFGSYQACTKPGLITFTFDDGVSRNFDTVLDVLKMEKITATFFIVGETIVSPAKLKVLQRAYREGHILANHTYSHVSLNSLEPDQIKVQLLQTQNALNYFAMRSNIKYVRPPFGILNQKTHDIVAKLGYTVVFWNLDTRDWDLRSARHILSRFEAVLSKSNPSKHSFIVLQHDRTRSSAVVLPLFIHAAKTHGYRIVDLHTCLFHP